jgi:hypothetical protein
MQCLIYFSGQILFESTQCSIFAQSHCNESAQHQQVTATEAFKFAGGFVIGMGGIGKYG